jgi:hypothetical protein
MSAGTSPAAMSQNTQSLMAVPFCPPLQRR